MTAKPCTGFANQLCWVNPENPSLVSAQLTTPKSKSNIHCQSAIATSEGMAQTRTSTLCSTMRGPRCIRVMSSATAVESATVGPTRRR